jgi:hypothetical protein
MLRGRFRDKSECRSRSLRRPQFEHDCAVPHHTFHHKVHPFSIITITTTSTAQLSTSEGANHSLDLLLRAELVGVTALLLAAVGGTGRQTGVAFPADHLLAVVLGGQGLEGGFDDAATQTEDEVEG